MKCFVKFSVIFFCGFSEVNVKASSSVNDSRRVKKEMGLQLPENCLKEEVFPCAIQSHETRWKINAGDVKVVLARNTTIVRKQLGKIQILSGEAWFFQDFSGKSFELSTEYGEVKTEKKINMFVKKTAEAIEIYPISGVVQVFPLGRGKEKGLSLPAGYRSYLGAVTESGVAHYEIPVAANLKGLIKSWAPLYDGTPQELSSELTRYREFWIEAVNEGSKIHQGLAEREIASEKSRQARLAELRRRRLKEELHLKNMFRKKNYLD